jgi:hypothetical protein
MAKRPANIAPAESARNNLTAVIAVQSAANGHLLANVQSFPPVRPTEEETSVEMTADQSAAGIEALADQASARLTEKMIAILLDRLSDQKNARLVKSVEASERSRLSKTLHARHVQNQPQNLHVQSAANLARVHRVPRLARLLVVNPEWISRASAQSPELLNLDPLIHAANLANANSERENRQNDRPQPRCPSDLAAPATKAVRSAINIRRVARLRAQMNSPSKGADE